MNKLMARIFAVVMVVVMLGTVSFAAEYTVDSSYASGVITTNKADDEAQATETVLAFATDTANATAPDTANGDVIIAIEQDVKAPETINIDTKKIEGLDYIIVVFSGTAGVPTYARIDNRAKEANLTAITFNTQDLEVNGQKYSNVVMATYTTAAAKEDGRKVKEYGAYFKQTSGDKTGADTSKDVPEKGNLIKNVLDNAVAYEGDLTFSVAIVGAPANAVFEATPYILYE